MYTQAVGKSIKNILKLKENFLNLSTKKLKGIHKIINNKSKPNSYINITTKDLSWKQIIIPIGENNIEKFMTLSDKHVANMNCAFRSIKSNTLIDFIYRDHQGLIVMANKVALLSNLSMVENHIKNVQLVDANNIQFIYLPKSKFYLKILGIPYLTEDTNIHINTSAIKTIIRSTYVFDNINIISKPRVIKVSPKSDIAIVWINI